MSVLWACPLEFIHIVYSCPVALNVYQVPDSSTLSLGMSRFILVTVFLMEFGQFFPWAFSW